MIDEEQLRYARLKNQFLIDRAPCSAVVSALCGLQAQFANNPKYALRVRGIDFDESSWSARLVKIWSFRHTLHAVGLDEMGVFLSARGVPKKWEGAWDIEGNRMEYLAGFLLEQMRSGALGRAELREKCRKSGLEQGEVNNIFNGWGGLFYEMNRRGLIAYRPGTAKTFMICENVAFTDTDAARAVLLRRYFKAFGPAT
ncbi:MAG: winged helix DNA-binding domain-containing protein, partial [Synergistaceae bacterium]|nr:winged helix DNA-binding domain-containing protein [Synergistaceae bacterium]